MSDKDWLCSQPGCGMLHSEHEAERAMTANPDDTARDVTAEEARRLADNTSPDVSAGRRQQWRDTIRNLAAQVERLTAEAEAIDGDYSRLQEHATALTAERDALRELLLEARPGIGKLVSDRSFTEAADFLARIDALLTGASMAGEAMERAALAILTMYSPATYCISLPRSEEREMLCKAGFLEWVPGPSWAGQNTYAITDAGRAEADRLARTPTPERTR